MSIHKSQWPKNFDLHPEHFENVLCVAQIFKWVKIKQAQGKIIVILGVSGNLKSESLAILREFNMDCQSYHTNVTNCSVLVSSHFRIDLPREDLRMKCAFTIDNPDTKDMDDALSCHELPSGNYEIGVHISDVSYYLKEHTPLDEMVQAKATSVYLINAAYNMLPDDLSSLCSLEPNKNKLTFSIFFEVAPDGTVLRKRGAKSVINSCAKLSYAHAQKFLDTPNRVFERGELPPIYHGFTSQDLSKSINTLQKVALYFRQGRKQNCGVRQSESCVSFRLDHVTGEPVGLVKEERIPSQELVEELMLLTNFTVAERIYGDFPNLALLRVHGPPNLAKLNRLQKNLSSLGMHIRVSSCKEIQDSIDKYSTDEVFKVVLNRLVSKCMQTKYYACSGTLKNAYFGHFSLGFPIYVHFTSPMRRYADVVTHRLLATSLKYRNALRLNFHEVSNIANVCTQQEFRAKKAAEASFDLYLSYYIERHQPFIQEAVVYNVKEISFDVVVFSTGSSLRIYANTFDEKWSWKSEKVFAGENNKPMWKMCITFPETQLESTMSIVVDFFTVVKVELMKAPRLNRLKARLCRP